jgi:hypothetical protein
MLDEPCREQISFGRASLLDELIVALLLAVQEARLGH